MKFVFFRHGETDNNVKKIMRGAGVDSPLNAKGIQQAKELVNEAKQLGFEKIYSSTLIRAIQTATLVAAECELNVNPINGVEEFHYGEVEGMYVPDAIEKYGMDKIFLNTNNPSVFDEALPGGETVNQCKDRLLKTIQQIKDECNGKCKCVAVFSHGAVMTILYHHFFKVHRKIANCEWFEIEI
jgi:probable phosphoglycerate mutase